MKAEEPDEKPASHQGFEKRTRMAMDEGIATEGWELNDEQLQKFALRIFFSEDCFLDVAMIDGKSLAAMYGAVGDFGVFPMRKLFIIGSCFGSSLMQHGIIKPGYRLELSDNHGITLRTPLVSYMRLLTREGEENLRAMLIHGAEKFEGRDWTWSKLLRGLFLKLRYGDWFA